MTITEIMTEPKVFCDCGKPAPSKCGDFSDFKMPRCGKPICSATDEWCAVHRHASGSMGYPANGKVRAEFKQFVPDENTIKNWLSTWFRNHFLTAQQKANLVWVELQTQWPPPAPMPELELQIKHRKFRSDGVQMVELDLGNRPK